MNIDNRTQAPVPEIPRDLPLNITTLPRKLLFPHEIEITETPPEILATSLASGELTSVEVTRAFLRRAGLAQKLVASDVEHESTVSHANGAI